MCRAGLIRRLCLHHFHVKGQGELLQLPGLYPNLAPLPSPCSPHLESSPISLLLSLFQLKLASLFPRKPFSLPSPKLFQPLHYASALPPPQVCLHLSPCAFPSPPAVPAAEAQPFRVAHMEEQGLFGRQLHRRCFFAEFSRKFLPVPG